MLRALAEVLEPGGRMAFFVIHTAPNLSAADTERARAAAPAETYTETAYESLVAASGLEGFDQTDVTTHYQRTIRSFLSVFAQYRDALNPEERDDLDERSEIRMNALAASEAGLLRRSLITAVKP